MMVSIQVLDKADDNYITKLSKLHMVAFPDFFLTQLGLPFLKTLYRGYMEDENSGIIVAEINGKLAGFIAYSNEYSQFYKGLLKRHLIRFAFCSLLAVIRHPSFCKRLLGAFKKSDDVKKEEAYVELASICVNPKAGGKGVGSRLIDKLKEITDFTIYEYINLETDACDNDVVNKFYIKNRFQLARSYVTAEGRKMNEYRYYGE
nr:GNAT family N-acetyltransferase [uncultured Sellimonas sp.]